jgi:hypothetical protein
MGRVLTLVGNLALGILALLCDVSGHVRAATPPQQFDASNFQAAAAKASEYCTTLWSDHAFDSLRDKIPLLGGQPTPSMLTNQQRVRPEDKPLADLALKTAEKCKAAATTAWALLPSQVHAKVLRLTQQSDALNTQLYKAKITFGEYNAKRVEILTQLVLTIASIPQGAPVATAQSAATVQDNKPLPPPKLAVQNEVPQISAPREVRIALVIGESHYLRLPKLMNPERDARSIAEALLKMGYDYSIAIRRTRRWH